MAFTLIISDDGRGLAIRKIQKLAIIQGLVDESRQLTALEIASKLLHEALAGG